MSQFIFAININFGKILWQWWMLTDECARDQYLQRLIGICKCGQCQNWIISNILFWCSFGRPADNVVLTCLLRLVFFY